MLALIIKAWWGMYKKMPKRLLAYFIAVPAFLATAIFDINVLIVIVCAGVIGLVASLITERRAEK